MNTYKWSRLSVLFALSLVMVLKFQNCAPAPGGNASNTSASSGTDPIVGVINPVNTSGVQFVAKAVEVQNSAHSVALDGICRKEQSGATLRWELRDDQDAELGEGYVDCDKGGFRIELAPVQSLECGRSYKLIAQLGLSESSPVEIRRDCPSDVAQTQ